MATLHFRVLCAGKTQTLSTYLPENVLGKREIRFLFLSCHNTVFMLWLGLGTKTTRFTHYAILTASKAGLKLFE